MQIIRTVTLGFLLAIAVLITAIVFTYYNTRNVLDANGLIAHTQKVLYTSEEIVAQTTPIAASYRTYLITGDTSYLKPQDPKPVQELYAKVDSLRIYLKSNPAQQARIDTLSEMITRRMLYADTAVYLIKTQGRQAAVDFVSLNGSKKILDRVRAIVTDIQTEEKRLLTVRQDTEAMQQRAYYTTFLGLIVAMFVILIALYLIIINNIKARGAAEAEMRDSRNLLHAIINNTSSNIFIKDLEGRYVLVNSTMAALFNKKPSQIVGLTDFDIVPDYVATKVREDDRQIAETAQLKEIEDDVPVNGEIRSYITAKFPIYNDKGVVRGVCGVTTDITQRKLAEKKLKDALTDIQDLYNYAPCGYHSLNENGVIIEINDTELKWLGYTRKEVVNKMRFTDLITTEGKTVFPKLFDQFKEKGHIDGVQYEMMRKDGTSFFAMLSATAIFDEQGNFKHSRTTIHDITEMKKGEREREELTKILQSQVQQLEEANAELNAFNYSASHDLRAPLRAISSFASLLYRDHHEVLTDDGKRLLDIIRSNAKKMAQLIDDLLIYSRIGRTAVNSGEVEMVGFAESITEELRDAYSNNLKAKFTFSEPNKVHCDKVLMRQVLLNLLGNAVKYSAKANNPQVHFGWYHVNNENVFYVKDNGAGFDMRYADKLFGVFQRLHSDVEFEGTGVGLAIVARIVQKHGGRVWAEGKTDEGATFYFTIPDYKNGYAAN